MIQSRLLKYRYIGMLILILSQTPALAQHPEILTILDGKPRGSEDVQALWLYNQAIALTDANAAYEIMTLIADDYSGDGAVKARLWKIRYHLAGLERQAAGNEVHLLPKIPTSAAWEPESRYWQTLIGESGRPDPSTRETNVPPWTIMTHLAAMPAADMSNRELRRVLALESVVRRWGLSGPWLWRLVQSDRRELKETATEMLAQAEVELRLDPVLPAIKDMLDDRSWLDDTPVSKEPVFQPTELPPTDIARTAEPEEEPPDTSRVFAVQVGAFLNVTAAQALARELESHGFPAYFREPDELDLLYRVRLGPTRTASAAESLGDRLSEALMLPYQIIEEL